MPPATCHCLTLSPLLSSLCSCFPFLNTLLIHLFSPPIFYCFISPSLCHLWPVFGGLSVLPWGEGWPHQSLAPLDIVRRSAASSSTLSFSSRRGTRAETYWAKMSCCVVCRARGSNASLSFCSQCFFLPLHVSSLNEGLDGWTQFPSNWNLPRQELERNRSPVCSCVGGVAVKNTQVSYLHRLWCQRWDCILSDTRTGSCQRCWCTFLPGTSLAAPGTHWCLPEEKKVKVSGHCGWEVCVISVSVCRCAQCLLSDLL